MKPTPKNLVFFGMATLSLFFLWFLPMVVSAQESDEAVKETEAKGTDLFDALEKSAEGFFEDRETQLEVLWERMEAEEEAKWTRLEKEVLQKWDIYIQTSKKIWVDYSPDREAVSIVNFETGKVVVEAIVPVSEPDPVGSAKELIGKKITELAEKEAPDGQPVMEEMLPQETVKALVDQKVEKVSEEPVPDDKPETEAPYDKPETEAPSPKEAVEVSPEAKIEMEVVEKPVIGKDGVERVKVRVTFSLVPDHLKRRARRYIQTVEEQAEKHGVEPALVMAVMHTESAFNPMARSPVPAFGLMQLVPRFAAKEAYQQIHGVEKVLTPAYLYNPKNNIELGTIYLARLQQIYFKDVADMTKRRYIAICAYNWGPTAMRRRFIKRINVKIDDLSPEALFRLLRQRVPNETKNYLKRVEERRELYRG